MGAATVYVNSFAYNFTFIFMIKRNKNVLAVTDKTSVIKQYGKSYD